MKTGVCALGEDDPAGSGQQRETSGSVEGGRGCRVGSVKGGRWFRVGSVEGVRGFRGWVSVEGDRRYRGCRG